MKAESMSDKLLKCKIGNEKLDLAQYSIND